MAAETFTTAMFLITAVIAAAVLINAIFPIVYNMAETFSSSSHAADVRLRTDITIVNTFASGNTAKVWIKNIGTEPIAAAQIQQSDVYFGLSNNFGMLTFTTNSPPGNNYWNAALIDLNGNGYWDPGETLQITAQSGTSYSSGTPLYFQFVLSNGISRSIQFNSS